MKYTTERDALIEKFFKKEDKYGRWLGGVEKFDGLDQATLQILIDKKYADPDERQNYSPTIGEFNEFLKKHPKFKAIAYAVEGKRSDCRISIEGIHGEDLTVEELEAFVAEFHGADEFEATRKGCRAWYD